MITITNFDSQTNGEQKRAVAVGHRRALPLGRALKPSALSPPLSISLSLVEHLRRSKTVSCNPMFGCSYSFIDGLSLFCRRGSVFDVLRRFKAGSGWTTMTSYIGS